MKTILMAMVVCLTASVGMAATDLTCSISYKTKGSFRIDSDTVRIIMDTDSLKISTSTNFYDVSTDTKGHMNKSNDIYFKTSDNEGGGNYYFTKNVFTIYPSHTRDATSSVFEINRLTGMVDGIISTSRTNKLVKLIGFCKRTQVKF